MKKIRCDVVQKDFLKVSVERDIEDPAIIIHSKDDSCDENVYIRLSPKKIRKLRKQLKKALREIEGKAEEKNCEDDWFSPGKKVVITNSWSPCGFPVGTVAIVRESWRNDSRSKKCEYLDGHDYWYVRPSDCKPYEEDEA